MVDPDSPRTMPEEETDGARGLYGISVAAELTDLGVQNIRSYERRGLLEPTRTGGGTRRYSNDDVIRLRRVRDLLQHGLNLAGISLVLQLEDENADLRTKIDHQTENRPAT